MTSALPQPPRPKGEATRFGANALSSVLTKVLQLTVLMWVNQYLVRRIDPEEYSLFPLISSLVFIAQTMATIGTGGVARYLVFADSRDDDAGVTTIVTSVMPVLLAIASLLAAVGCWVVIHLDQVLVIAEPYVWDAQLMLSLIVGMICMNVLTTPFTSGPYVRQRFSILNAVRLGTEFLRMALLLILLMGVSTRVIWLVVATVTTEALNVIAMWRITRRMMPAVRIDPKRFEFQQTKQLLNFGGWSSLAAVGDFVLKTCPLLLLNQFSTAFQVSAFHLGRLPEIHSRRIITSGIIPLQPALTRIYAIQGEHGLENIYYRGNRYCLWVALFFLAPLIVFSNDIFDLYVGPDYRAASKVMVIFFARYPFIFASTLFYRMAHALANLRAFYAGQSVIFVVALAAMFYAAQSTESAVSVALAIAVPEAVLHVVLIWSFGLRLVNGTWRRFIKETLAFGSLPFASSMALCVTFSESLHPTTWLDVATVLAAASLAYVTVLLIFCLDATERITLCAMCAKFRSTIGRRFHRVKPEQA